MNRRQKNIEQSNRRKKNKNDLKKSGWKNRNKLRRNTKIIWTKDQVNANVPAKYFD
jgi:hypothetical protein